MGAKGDHFGAQGGHVGAQGGHQGAQRSCVELGMLFEGSES